MRDLSVVVSLRLLRGAVERHTSLLGVHAAFVNLVADSLRSSLRLVHDLLRGCARVLRLRRLVQRRKRFAQQALDLLILRGFLGAGFIQQGTRVCQLFAGHVDVPVVNVLVRTIQHVKHIFETCLVILRVIRSPHLGFDARVQQTFVILSILRSCAFGCFVFTSVLRAALRAKCGP